MNKEDIKKLISGTYDKDIFCEYGITHYRYDDCDEKNLIIAEGEYLLHKDCVNAFNKMQQAAKEEGIDLFIVSAFRSKKYQIDIFKYKFKDKNNPTEEELKARLEFSAPSGYSEHHTGLAIDINSLEQDFEEDVAYTWLVNNAHKFGFENSFPKDNKQHVGFEPWHWRYVGNDFTKGIFKNASKLVS